MVGGGAVALSPCRDQVQKCLSYRSLQDRCSSLRMILETYPISDLAEVLPTVVSSLFNASSDWKMRSTRPSRGEENCLVDVLCPTGCMFRLIYQLEEWHSFRLSFPAILLPRDTENRVKSGNVDAFYANKLQFTAGGEIHKDLLVSAFEYYFLSLLGYVIHPSNQKNDYWADANHWTVDLFQRYLNFFMPPTSGGGGVENSVLNLSSLLRKADGSGGSAHLTSQANYLHYVKTFCIVITEMLLKLNPISSLPIGVHSSIEVPSQDHMRLIRMLIKHIHEVVTPCLHHSQSHNLSFGGGVSQHNENSVLEDFYRTVMSDFFSKPLYNTLSLAFHSWPTSWSSRLLVETWLSFIQPWRQGGMSESLNHWAFFIEDNLCFYTQLFHDALPHLLRMDFTLGSNAQVAFRIGKVFSTAGLKDLLENLEASQPAKRFMRSESFPGAANIYSSVRLGELPGSEKEYRPMFSVEVTNAAGRIVQSCFDAVHKLRSGGGGGCSPTAKAQESLWESVVSLSKSMVDSNVYLSPTTNHASEPAFTRSANPREVIQWLESAISNWCTLFSLDKDQFSALDSSSQLNVSPATLGAAAAAAANSDDSQYPDHIMGENGPILTELGRVQIFKGVKKFGIGYGGDPDLQPLRSFENRFLVRTALRISDYINCNNMHTLNRLYCRKDIVGRVSELLITGPLVRKPSCMAPPASLTRTNRFTFVPHVSLRFIGNYYLIGWCCMLLLLLRIVFSPAFLALSGAMLMSCFCALVFVLHRLGSHQNQE